MVTKALSNIINIGDLIEVKCKLNNSLYIKETNIQPLEGVKSTLQNKKWFSSVVFKVWSWNQQH